MKTKLNIPKRDVITYIIIFFFLPIKIYSQSEFFYFSDTQKTFLIPVDGKWVVDYNSAPVQQVNGSEYPGTKINETVFLVTDTVGLSLYGQFHLMPSYIAQDYGNEVYLTSNIVLKFKDGISTQAKADCISNNNLIFVSGDSFFEIYRSSNALVQANAVFETGLVDFSLPDFIDPSVALNYYPNDDFFSNQFYLHNTGQVNQDGQAGTIDADIDAPEAWDITKGDPSIIIAVIDEGVTSNHVDLPNSRQVRLNGSNFAGGLLTMNDPSPANVFMGAHGNQCAGVIAATQDNLTGVTGIAPLCKIMPIRCTFWSGTPISQHAMAIDFAVANNANIINCSWGGGIPNVLTTSAIQNAIDANVVVVFAAGNNANHAFSGNGGPQLGWVDFPANSDIDDLISVGASDRDDKQANYSASSIDIDLVAPSNKAYPDKIENEVFNIWTMDTPGDWGSNPWLSFNLEPIIPYGEILPSSGVEPKSFTGRFGGTSAAAPQVAGVAALMLSVNPCLSPFQIKQIVQKTADKIGGYNYNWNGDLNGHSEEMGYGRLNAHQAVVAAQSVYSSTLDLSIRDVDDDIGSNAGYNWGYLLDESPDIWLRNQDDGLTNRTNEVLEYQNNSQVFVYVRVTNMSCVTSSGLEEVSLYWTKAAANTSWPQNWDGSSPLTGNKISDMIIPILQPGETTILTFPWTMVQNSGVGSTWHNCFMARIENSTQDPIVSYTSLAHEIYYNNNVSLRNSMVVDYIPGINGNTSSTNSLSERERYFYVGNVDDVAVDFDLLLFSDSLDSEPISEVAEINIFLDDDGWDILGPILQTKGNIEINQDSSFTILGNSPFVLENVNFPANTRIPLKIVFNFLIDEVDGNSQHKYRVVQKKSTNNTTFDNDWTGGVHFQVNRYDRDYFNANAGNNQQINSGETVFISAEQINEAAVYNWYNSMGDLIFTGEDLSVSPEITEEYRLEVISLLDGYKDYDSVIVEVSENTINTLSPNPASNIVTVNYTLNNTNSAYLNVIGNSGYNVSNNYLLDNNLSQSSFDVSSYQPGIYTVLLICDGLIKDAVSLSVQ